MAVLLIPTRIKPTWAMEEKARNLLIFCCRNAKRFPIIIVAMDKIISILYHSSAIGLNTLYKAAMKIKAMDPFDITDKKAVVAIGAPSYTSAVHK